MSDDHLNAEKKMSKARVVLVLDDPFLGSLSMRLEMREMTEVEMQALSAMGIAPTCTTNGVDITYNKKWIDELSLEQCKGLLAHEVAHVALKHHIRRGEREFKKWNWACDHAIDPILQDCGYELPPGSHIKKEYLNKAAEQIYALMDINRPQQPQGDGQSPAGDPGDDDDGGGKKEDQNKRSKSSKPKSSAGNGKPDPSQTTVNTGPGIIQDAPVDMHDKQALQEFEEDLTMAIEAAAKVAKNAGMLPGYIEQIIEAEKEHEIDYKELLRDWLVKNVFPDNYTWQRPSRRFLPHGMYLPSLNDGYDLPKLVCYCDTSGSVGQSERVKYANEISGVLEEFPCEIDVIYGDTRVTNVQHFASDELPIKLDMKGSGGTYFMPAFEYIKDNKIECEALLFFTDMGAFDWPQVEKMAEPDYPVLWMNTCRYSDDTKVPFGTVIKLEKDVD